MIEETRSRWDLPRLLLLMGAIALGTAAIPAHSQSDSDNPQPSLILQEGCCFIPPTSPLASQMNPPPDAAPQTEAPPLPGPSDQPAQTAPMPPTPAAVTGTASAPPPASTPLNAEFATWLVQRGNIVDALRSMLEGSDPKQEATRTDAGQGLAPTRLGPSAQRTAGLTATLPWKVLEVLSLVFALGIAAAAAYFSTHHKSGMSD